MTTLELTTSLAQAEGVIKTHLQRRATLQEEFKALQTKSFQLEAKRQIVSKSIEYLNHLVTTTRQDVYNTIAKIVNFGLKDIFDNKTEFFIQADQRGDVPSCRFMIRTEDHPEWEELERTQEAHGNGLVSITAFLLRVVIHKLYGRAPDFIMLDDPFKEVSASYINGIGHLLQELHKIFKLQFIIITHSQQLASFADTQIKLEKY